MRVCFKALKLRCSGPPARACGWAECRRAALNAFDSLTIVESCHSAGGDLANGCQGGKVAPYLLKGYAHARSNLGVKALAVLLQIL